MTLQHYITILFCHNGQYYYITHKFSHQYFDEFKIKCCGTEHHENS